MKSTYKRLTELLGLPPGGVSFEQLNAEFGYESIEDDMFVIPSLGVSLIVIDKLVSVVCFHIDTPETREGPISHYRGDLPYAINQDDGPETIEQKLSARPVSPEKLHGMPPKGYAQYTYVIPPHVFIFDFEAATKKLSAISILLSEARHWAGYTNAPPLLGS